MGDFLRGNEKDENKLVTRRDLKSHIRKHRLIQAFRVDGVSLRWSKWTDADYTLLEPVELEGMSLSLKVDVHTTVLGINLQSSNEQIVNVKRIKF